jgi:hypothetical protein
VLVSQNTIGTFTPLGQLRSSDIRIIFKPNRKVAMRLRILRIGLVLAVAASPAIARQKYVVPTPQPAVSTYCATIDPGNPISKVYDYQAWSAWRARGLWDSSGDFACARNPLSSPPRTATLRPDTIPKPKLVLDRPNWHRF